MGCFLMLGISVCQHQCWGDSCLFSAVPQRMPIMLFFQYPSCTNLFLMMWYVVWDWRARLKKASAKCVFPPFSSYKKSTGQYHNAVALVLNHNNTHHGMSRKVQKSIVIPSYFFYWQSLSRMKTWVTTEYKYRTTIAINL